MKRLLPVLCCLLVSVLLAAELPAKFGTLAAGAVAPDFKVVGADGKEAKLSDFKGRVVVLNFWATNRGPADVLESAFLRHQEAGVIVLGVCTNATREEFDAWRAKNQGAITYPVFWDSAAKARAESVAQKHFGVGVFPATGVIDREGRVVGGFVGFGAATPVMLRSYLREAGVPIPEEEAPKRAAPPAASAMPEDRTLQAGVVAPDFTNLDLAGRSVKLSDFAGKIVVLDFWATWCGPCLEAMPHTQKIAAAAKAQDVVVFAACTSDTRAQFETWLKQHGAKYPDLVFVNDPNGRDTPAERYAERASVKLYGVSGIPTQFVIGRDGKITATIRGYGAGDTRLEQALAALGVKLP